MSDFDKTPIAQQHKGKKLCLACSVGGHLTQMRQMREMYEKYDHFYITEDTLITQVMKKEARTYLVRLVNRRNPFFAFILLGNSFRIWGILRRERPDVIISTGALNTVPVCYIGKMLGARVVFIESFAKVNSPTLSGRIVSRIADLFLVQWEQMKAFYPKAIYGGSLY